VRTEESCVSERPGPTRVDDASRTWRLDLHGDIDLATAPALSDRLGDLAHDQAVLVIVNLADVEFLDSSGLRALVYGARAIEDAGGRLLVEGASGAVARVLELTNLLERLSARDD
jgi:anti-sigma B factor antagonist